VRRLHAQGITGRRVGIAIIDSFLYTGHQEYRDRLRWYDEIDGRQGDPAVWHGTAAAVEEARRAGILVASLDLGAAPYGPVRIASAAAPDRYLTVGAAGSWSMAYWAGRYALPCQQDPSITPERFRQAVFEER